MAKRLVFETDDDGNATQFADLSNSLYNEAVDMAIAEGMPAHDALKQVLSRPIEAVEDK